MKNILILGDGAIAKHFVEWVGRKRIGTHRYYVTCNDPHVSARKQAQNITFLDIDPTSYIRVKTVMEEVNFSRVFIVLKEKTDAYYALKNVRMHDSKIHIVLTDQWDDEEIAKEEENVTVIRTNALLAAHLYDQLPDVPVVAQNVGLGQGEIMEMLIPFGSTFAYRHIGSILQRKWKIAAVYRNNKFILPTNADMLKPNDTILAVGKPLVLDSVYKMVNKRIGMFPEPFGKEIYLLLSFEKDKKNIFRYLEEARYFSEKLPDRSLYVRIVDLNDFDALEKIKTYESERLRILVCYDTSETENLVEYDIQYYDIGLICISKETFGESIGKSLYALRKAVYIFGRIGISEVEKAVVSMEEDRKMESISASAFDVAQTLDLGLCLCHFDPEGDFESKRYVIEHYETLSSIFDYPVDIVQETANPVRKLHHMQRILQIVPFEPDFTVRNWLRYFSTHLEDFVLIDEMHPKLLIPYVLSEE